MQDYQQAAAYIATLTGDVNSVVDFRAINETNRNVPGIPRRGTLFEHWNELVHWNNQGYGIYVIVAATDGVGRRIENVTTIRANYVDLDGVDALQQLEAAKVFNPAPAFAVQSSPGKFHVYWSVNPHNDRDRFTMIQRKLVSRFNSDPTIIDPTRVMRLPGTLHMKNPAAPSLVTCFALAGYGQRAPSDALELALYSVTPSDYGGGSQGVRTPIGHGDRAPSTGAAIDMLNRIDVTQMTDRNQWVAVAGAFMQSVDPADMALAYDSFQAWNAPYPGNDPAANHKVWADIERNGTTVKGWSRLHKEAVGLTPQQARLLGGAQMPINAAPIQMSEATAPSARPDAKGYGPILNPQECSEWFDKCVLISSENLILGADNVFRDSGKFNSKYGGKLFIWDAQGKVTNEPWMAATRSQLWRVPQTQFTCFRPDLPERAVIQDGLKRDYVNTYIRQEPAMKKGDPSPWLNHLAIMLPDPNDRRILIEFLAHNVKYPGIKIFWAPLVQGAEGIGKNAIKFVMNHAIGEMYFYEPKAKQLNESGAKFNGWMENRVFFIVDEIKTDEQRELVETLKPFITETRLEIEGKGANQKMGDIPGNWLFFSNWKDAIPISKNGRRFTIFYSALQTLEDITAAGLTDAYFKSFYDWLKFNGGKEIVTDYLMNYPIECGSLPARAPVTTSTLEAIEESRGWMEQLIMAAVEAGDAGFRNGWLSTAAVSRVFRENGKRPPAGKTLAAALKNLGYHRIGQNGRGYFGDDPQFADRRAWVWHVNPAQILNNYATDQGYAS